ncbi:hypothetical protein Tco_0872810 [Tanacetum coccineum]
MTPPYSEAFSHWRSAPLSTPYPSTTSESSLDSFSERSLDSSLLFAEPSRKRCRSPPTSVPSSTPVSRLIAPTHADLLPPYKRFRDSYSPEDSRKEHIEIGFKIAASDIREDEEEFEAEASAGGTMEIIVDLLVTGGISESTRGNVPYLKDTLYDIRREIAGLTDRIRRLGLENLKVQALFCIKRDRVDNLHHHMALSQEEFHQIRRDRDDARRRLKRLESFVERLRDSYSSEDSREEHMEIEPADAEAVADLGIGDRVRAHLMDGIGMGVEVVASDIREDEKEFEVETSTRGRIEIEVDPRVRPIVDEDVLDHVTHDGVVEVIQTYQRQLEYGQLMASGDRVDSLRHHMALSQEEFHQIRRDRYDARRRLRRLESFVERRLGFCP